MQLESSSASAKRRPNSDSSEESSDESSTYKDSNDGEMSVMGGDPSSDTSGCETHVVEILIQCVDILRSHRAFCLTACNA